MNRDQGPIGGHQFAHSSNRYLRRTVAISLISVAGIVLFFLLIPTIFVMNELGPGAFLYQTAFEQTSPDGRFKLEVRCRINFPVNELIDPSGTVSVKVIDHKTSTLIDEKTFWIHEYRELQDPELDWRTDAVAISKIETHNDVMFELNLLE